MKTDEHKMTQLGYALREYRVRHNMTQQELAEKLGVSTNTIHLWETKCVSLRWGRCCCCQIYWKYHCWISFQRQKKTIEYIHGHIISVSEIRRMWYTVNS